VLMPVTLPPGRLKLATRPACTGSVPMLKTIGISVVAAFAARAAATVSSTTISATRCRIRSSAAAGRQSVGVAVCPAELAGNVLAVDDPSFGESLADGGNQGIGGLRCSLR
jgi:hypothetical protein